MRNTVLAITITLAVGCGADRSAPDAGLCVTPEGCDPILGCPDSGGCNWCGCNQVGASYYGCLAVACLASDGGPRPGATCHATSECPSGQRCAFALGCKSSTGICTRTDACNSFAPGDRPAANSPLTVCDCSGHTVTVTWICGVEQPYAHSGPCG